MWLFSYRGFHVPKQRYMAVKVCLPSHSIIITYVVTESGIVEKIFWILSNILKNLRNLKCSANDLADLLLAPLRSNQNILFVWVFFCFRWFHWTFRRKSSVKSFPNWAFCFNVIHNTSLVFMVLSSWRTKFPCVWSTWTVVRWISTEKFHKMFLAESRSL